MSGDSVDQWSYKIVSACFANECPAPAPKKPTAQRDPRTTCAALCDADDKLCLKYHLGKDPIERQLASQFDGINRDLAYANPPHQLSLQPLVDAINLVNGNKLCARTDLVIPSPAPTDPYPKVENDGSSCSVSFPMQHPDSKEMQLRLPGQLRGTFEHQNPAQFAITTEDESTSPSLYIGMIADGSVVKEPVVQWSGEGNKMTFTGQRLYCGRIEWDPIGLATRAKARRTPRK